jgi:hypothetical protein
MSTDAITLLIGLIDAQTCAGLKFIGGLLSGSGLDGSATKLERDLHDAVHADGLREQEVSRRRPWPSQTS